MSLYEVQRLIHALNIEPALAERFRAEPAAVLAGYELDETERAALLDADTVALWNLGVHPLLMLHYCRARQIPAPRMLGQIAPLAGQRPLQSARKR